MPKRTCKSNFRLGEADIIEMSVDALKHILASKPLFPILQAISFRLRDLKRSKLDSSLSLAISAQAPEPVQEIISAATDGRLRLIPSLVLMCQNDPQTVLAVFVDDRPVGRIFHDPDKLSLHLDIGTVTVIRRLDARCPNARPTFAYRAKPAAAFGTCDLINSSN